MMDDAQLDLFSPLVPVPRRGTIAERYAEFMRRNPHLYGLIVAMAREMRDAGAGRLSMKHIVEEMRARRRVVLKSDDEFKIDNSYTSLLARDVREREPDLAGLFEVRIRKAA